MLKRDGAAHSPALPAPPGRSGTKKSLAALREAERAGLRRARLLRRFRREKIDALLTTNVHNVRYLSGFLGDDSALLVAPERTFLLTDSRYAEQAEAETRGIVVVVRKKGMMQAAGTTARKAGIRALGVEARAMALAESEDLRKALRGIELRPTRGLVERLRAVKDACGGRGDPARGADRAGGVPADAAAGRPRKDRAEPGAVPGTGDGGPGRRGARVPDDRRGGGALFAAARAPDRPAPPAGRGGPLRLGRAVERVQFGLDTGGVLGYNRRRFSTTLPPGAGRPTTGAGASEAGPESGQD